MVRSNMENARTNTRFHGKFCFEDNDLNGCVYSFHLFLTSGHNHPYNWMSPFLVLGVSGGCHYFHYVVFALDVLSANNFLPIRQSLFYF